MHLLRRLLPTCLILAAAALLGACGGSSSSADLSPPAPPAPSPPASQPLPNDEARNARLAEECGYRPWMSEVAQTFTRHRIEVRGANQSYYLFRPRTEANRRYPLIIALHGLEHFGPGLPFLQSRGSQAAAGMALGWAQPIFQERNPAFVLAPHIENEGRPLNQDETLADSFRTWEAAGSVELLRSLIERMLANEAIDPNRVYLTGHSYGGRGSFLVPALHLTGRFAAIVPMDTNLIRGEDKLNHLAQAIDGGRLDYVSVAAAHHRFDDAGRSLPSLVDRLSLRGHSVVLPIGLGDQAFNLSAAQWQQKIDQRERYFYIEYRDIYPPNLHCAMNQAVIEPKLHEWLFRQYLLDPNALSLVASNAGQLVWRAQAKSAADQLEVWLRAPAANDWQRLAVLPATQTRFDLGTNLRGSRFRLNLINAEGFSYAELQGELP